MTHVTCRLTAKNRGQGRNRTVIEYWLRLPLFYPSPLLPLATTAGSLYFTAAAVTLREVSEAVYRVSLRILFCSPIRRAESWSQHGSFCT